MLKKKTIISLLSLILMLPAATAGAHQTTLPDDHAPIGVMGDHTHKPGEWMLSYRYNRMEMRGNRDGTTDLTPAAVLGSFMVAPLDMTMEMHSFGGMYGLSDRWTVTAMLPYLRKSMNSVNLGGVRFRTSASGIGDAKIGGIFTVFNNESRNGRNRQGDILLLNFGLSLPTGAIDKRDATPANPSQKLAYGMQLGSGTFDPSFGITYTKKYNDWSWGGQLSTLQPVGMNSEGYRQSSHYNATGWVARVLSDSFSASFRLDGKNRSDIDGRDPALNPAMAAGARPDLRAATQLDAAIGLNFYQQGGALDGHRLALELGIPLYQNLDGPQLKSDWRLTAGWQKAF